MQPTQKPTPGFTRQGRCAPWAVSLLSCRPLARLVLGRYIAKQVNVRKKQPGVITYLFNPRDSQFIQVCAQNVTSPLNFRFDTHSEDGSRLTLQYGGNTQGLSAFAKQYQLRIF